MDFATRDEYFQWRRELEEKVLQDQEAWREKVQQIAKHRETQVIRRDDFLSAWEYVEKKFPRLRSILRGITVYKNTNTAFCMRMGIPKESGGFFIVHLSIIILCYTRVVPDDVVLVHEMLHYASQVMGSRFHSEDYEEDFAYQEAIPYILDRGYEEGWISEKFLLPYYLHRERRDALQSEGKRSFSRSEIIKLRKHVVEKCNHMVRNWLRNPVAPSDDEKEDPGRFSFL